MKRAITYELFLGFLYGGLILFFAVGSPPDFLLKIKTPILCCLFGGIGGATYCLRGVYISACVNNAWNNGWLPWYFIRPLVSFVCGGVSWVFLNAGLIILESQQSTTASQFAFYALSFIAGLNVDKFINKLEDIAVTVWGIEKSRTSKSSSAKQEE